MQFDVNQSETNKCLHGELLLLKSDEINEPLARFVFVGVCRCLAKRSLLVKNKL